jgi:hypothetical protein
MDKLLGVEMAPMTQQMPIGFPLCQPKIDAVRQWIDDDAPIE